MAKLTIEVPDSIIEGGNILLHSHTKSQNCQAFSFYKGFDCKADDNCTL